MKILFTGMSLQQTGYQPVIGYQPVSSAVVTLLRDLGHSVDQRHVEVGEDLGQYDLLAVGILSLFSISSKYLYPVLSLLDRYRDEKPLVCLIDDWECWQIPQNTRSASRNLSRLRRPAVYARKPGYAWACSPEGQAAIARVVHRAAEDGYPPAIWPAFGWGGHSVMKSLVDAEAYFPLDVTSYAARYPVSRLGDAERRRAWVLGVIKKQPVEWAGSLGLGWELDVIGGGGRQTAGVIQERIQEHALVRRYAESWGVLSPFYRKLAGSGWWRNRYVYSAMTGAVLWGDPREAPQLGPAYQVPVAAIEGMSISELRELAEAQRDALAKGCWTGERLHAEAERMIAAVTDSR